MMCFLLPRVVVSVLRLSLLVICRRDGLRHRVSCVDHFPDIFAADGVR
jgi:hypothetical protein